MSAIAVKINGADLSPKGNLVSIKMFPCHSISSSNLSAGWTGMILYALLMSVFASMVPLPNMATTLATSSTEMYDSEHSSGLMPSLTLEPEGLDRSSISLHFPGE